MFLEACSGNKLTLNTHQHAHARLSPRTGGLALPSTGARRGICLSWKQGGDPTGDTAISRATQETKREEGALNRRSLSISEATCRRFETHGE